MANQPGTATSPSVDLPSVDLPSTASSCVDWPALRDAARDVMARAYAPYSQFPVGAAGLVDDGRVVVGCNVENAAYGLALCAECSMISALIVGGGGKLVAVACVQRTGATVMPCGRCRQLLWEHGGPGMLLDTPRGVLPMADVLPMAFGPEDLRVGIAGESEPTGQAGLSWGNAQHSDAEVRP